MPFLSSSKCILFLSDEGVSIYDVTAHSVSLLDMVPWDSPDMEKLIITTVSKRSSASKIQIINDMVEQHYRKERVPNVGFLDKANVIKRRVSVAFPSYPIRTGIKLKEKAIPSDKEEAPGSLYLFAAIPLSDNIRRLITSVNKCYKSFGGLALLPVESASLVQALSRKLTMGGGAPARWSILVGQHRGGGVRQVVVKNGELALTRLTSITENDSDREIWSSEIVNEIRSTMGYLSRFGFEPSDGLDLIVIADNSVAEKITSKIDFECNLNVMTSGEAASLLGLRIGRQEDLRYAESLHLAWTARKKSLTMPLQSTQIQRAILPRRIATAVAILMFMGVCYLGYQAYVKHTQWMKNEQDLRQAQASLAEIKLELNAEISKKEEAGVDFLFVQSATKKYRELDEKAMKPLPMMEKIGQALGSDLSLASLEIIPIPAGPPPEQKFDEVTGEPLPLPPVKNLYNITLIIVFPPDLAPEKGVEQVNSLVSRLRVLLPKHDVSVMKQVADLSYTGNFVGETVTPQSDNIEKKDYEAEIRIRGEML